MAEDVNNTKKTDNVENEDILENAAQTLKQMLNGENKNEKICVSSMWLCL